MRRYRASLLALAMVSALGCGHQAEEAVKREPAVVKGATVVSVASEAIPELQEAVGSVKARNSALIAARLTGSVSGVYAREGDRVGQGKLLASIEAVESSAAAAGSLSGVEEASRALDEARARKRLADATFGRYEKLFADQAITRQEYEVKQAEKETATQGVARAEARLKQARESAKAAGAVAGYGKVTAPISGVVIARQVETGQTVFPGTPLFTVEGEGGYRLEVAAPEGLLGKVKGGEEVGIAVEGAPATGRVAEIVPLVHPTTRTFTVKIDLTGRGLRSGAYGKALFRTGSRQGIAVPASAVVQRGALTSVWTVSPQGIARLRLVKLGDRLGDRVEVLSGLVSGERIVTGGIEQLSDGAKVE